MRGGRNKFGPMYKRDRARKLQVLRHRHVPHHQMMGSPVVSNGTLSYQAVTQASGANGQQGGHCGATMYSPPLTHIKQEIQIPTVTSMTSSPDSSPSPVQLGPPQIGNSQTGGTPGNVAGIAAVLASVGGTQAGGTNQAGGHIITQHTDPNTGGVWQISTSPNQAKVHIHILTL